MEYVLDDTNWLLIKDIIDKNAQIKMIETYENNRYCVWHFTYILRLRIVLLARIIYAKCPI